MGNDACLFYLRRTAFCPKCKCADWVRQSGLRRSCASTPWLLVCNLGKICSSATLPGLREHRDDCIGHVLPSFGPSQACCWFRHRVRIVVAPPKTSWNGKFAGVGSGGSVGLIEYRALSRLLARGYATVATNSGHHSEYSYDVTWAFGQPERVTDFGYRAQHIVTEIGKLLTQQFYGRLPQHSYFIGCSQGGMDVLRDGTLAHCYPPTSGCAPRSIGCQWRKPMRDIVRARYF